MTSSDLLMVLAATALLKPCFFKNRLNTALASSFSAANRLGGTTLKLIDDPSTPDSAVSFASNKCDPQTQTQAQS